MNEHVPGTKLAEQLVTQPQGATMAEIIAATGGPRYNVLKSLEARGYRLRKVKEGKETRYFAEPPASPSYEATVTGKGQITLPKEVRCWASSHGAPRSKKWTMPSALVRSQGIFVRSARSDDRPRHERPCATFH
jgi:hypothetical protein